MWKDINNYIHMRYNTKLYYSNFGIITHYNGWGNDSSSVGFLFCPINVYKNSLNT
mgnify:FL=1